MPRLRDARVGAVGVGVLMQRVGVMQLSHVLVGLAALCGGGAVAVSFYEKLQCCVALLGPCRPRWRQLHEVAVGDVASMISVYAKVPAVCAWQPPKGGAPPGGGGGGGAAKPLPQAPAPPPPPGKGQPGQQGQAGDPNLSKRKLRSQNWNKNKRRRD